MVNGMKGTDNAFGYGKVGPNINLMEVHVRFDMRGKSPQGFDSINGAYKVETDASKRTVVGEARLIVGKNHAPQCLAETKRAVRKCGYKVDSESMNSSSLEAYYSLIKEIGNTYTDRPVNGF